jgi:pimeloyl-ACP methyl ester carboxylesterase
MYGPANPMSIGYVPVDGAEVFFQEKGEGPALILIHGGGLNRKMWGEQLNFFARYCRVIQYDVRGHGQSKCSRDAYADHEDLKCVMEYLKIEKAAVMGLSMGGRVAIDFALEHPEKVAVLIPVAPGLSGFDFADTEKNENYPLFIEALKKGDAGQTAEYMQRMWTDGPHRTPEETDPELRKKVRAMLMETFEGGGFPPHSAWPDPPAVGRLSEINVPTLAVVGDKDMPDILTIVDLLKKNIKGAKVEIVPGAAHMVNMEKPGEFNEIVLEFLRSVKWISPSRIE